MDKNSIEMYIRHLYKGYGVPATDEAVAEILAEIPDGAKEDQIYDIVDAYVEAHK